MILRKLYYALPASWRFLARRLFYLPTDWWELATGKRSPMQPPRGLVYTGGGDFIKAGARLMERFVRLGRLQTDHQVLDIGSGIGRAALPLTGYLGANGGYEGFDVVELGVHWCTEQITRRYPNFRFTYVPLANDLYRTDGSDAASFRFPYEDDRFDFAIANSLFTHMLPEEVGNYLGEIRRVLKPGGKCYATFFILNETSKKLMAGQPEFQFRHDHGNYFLFDEKVKSANVGFEEGFLRKMVVENGLTLSGAYYGFWPGRPQKECEDFQDLLILEK